MVPVWFSLLFSLLLLMTQSIVGTPSVVLRRTDLYVVLAAAVAAAAAAVAVAFAAVLFYLSWDGVFG